MTGKQDVEAFKSRKKIKSMDIFFTGKVSNENDKKIVTLLTINIHFCLSMSVLIDYYTSNQL